MTRCILQSPPVRHEGNGEFPRKGLLREEVFFSNCLKGRCFIMFSSNKSFEFFCRKESAWRLQLGMQGPSGLAQKRHSSYDMGRTRVLSRDFLFVGGVFVKRKALTEKRQCKEQ